VFWIDPDSANPEAQNSQRQTLSDEKWIRCEEVKRRTNGRLRTAAEIEWHQDQDSQNEGQNASLAPLVQPFSIHLGGLG
jgi:hypothetical protein